MEALDATGLPYVIEENIGFNEADYQCEGAVVGERLKSIVSPNTQFMVGPSPELGTGTITVRLMLTDDSAAGRAATLLSELTVAPPFSVLLGDP